MVIHTTFATEKPFPDATNLGTISYEVPLYEKAPVGVAALKHHAAQAGATHLTHLQFVTERTKAGAMITIWANMWN